MQACRILKGPMHNKYCYVIISRIFVVVEQHLAQGAELWSNTRELIADSQIVHVSTALNNGQLDGMPAARLVFVLRPPRLHRRLLSRV